MALTILSKPETISTQRITIHRGTPRAIADVIYCLVQLLCQTSKMCVMK